METNEKQAEMLRQDALVSGRLIAKYLPEEIRPLIRAIIKKAFIDAGFLTAVADGRLDDMATNQTSDLKRFHYDLTMEEVGECCLLGVLKILGEYTSISRVTINDWLSKYRNMTARQEALKRVRANTKPEYKIPEMSEEKIKKLQQELVGNIIAEYERTGEVLNFGNANYEFMEREGLIPKDDYKRFVMQSKELRFKELGEEKAKCYDPHRIARINEEMDGLMDDEAETLYTKRVAGTHSIIDWIKKQQS